MYYALDLVDEEEPNSTDHQGHTVLHHYTTYAGLEGIVSKKAMWCTQIQYLNDFSELRHGLNVLEKVGIEEYKDTGLFGDVDTSRHIFNVASNSVFVCSFTQKGDLLSQWRGYGGTGGVSISYSAEALRQKARQQGFRLHKCIYDEDTKFDLTRKYLKAIFKEAAESPIDRRLSTGELADRFLPIAALFKDESFKEEEEWRLVSPLFPHPQANDIKFRATSTGLIPYIILDLNNGHEPVRDGYRGIDDICIRSVKIGPNREQELQKLAVKALFGANYAMCRWEELSEIPYRPL